MNLTEPLYGAGTVKIGPFLSVQDAKTPMTNLNITRTNVRLSKNNGPFEPKANLNPCTHDKNGWYDVPLLSDDTDETGQLLTAIHVSGALPVFRKFEVYNGVAPEITVDPESQDLNVGDKLTLTVTATGDSPLHYQWKQDGDNVGTDSNTYEKSNVQESDVGDYTCVVTNHFGSDESNAATVTVTENLSAFANYNLEHLND